MALPFKSDNGSESAPEVGTLPRAVSTIPGKVVLREDLQGIDISTLTTRLNWLRGTYSSRDAAIAKIRDYYAGIRLVSELESEGLRLVSNDIKRIIDTYVDFMAIPADFQVPPPFESDEGRNLADKIEKLLYSQWSRNHQGILTHEMNHNLVAFGGSPIYVHPSRMDEIEMGQYVRIIVPKPEGFYPVVDGSRRFVYSEVFYVEKKKNIDIRREFSNYKVSGSDYDETEVTYYWNKNYYIVFCNQDILKRVEHKWGFVPWVYIPNRVYSADLLSDGETDQSIALIKYMNELLSDLGDIVDYYANPTVIGAGTGMNRKDWQPGGYNEIRPGGKVEFLEWKGNSQVEILSLYNTIKGLVETMTGNTAMPTSTGARGAKQVMAQMMPFDVRLNSKRLIEAEALSVLNTYLLRMIEKIYGNMELKIRGTKKGQSFSMNMKANQIHGYYDNRILWAPGPIDYTQRIVRTLQLVGNGIISKYTAREMLGIASPQDEEKRVYSEKLHDLRAQLELTGKLEEGKAALVKEQQKRLATESELMGGAEEASKVEGEGRALPGRPKEKGEVEAGTPVGKPKAASKTAETPVEEVGEETEKKQSAPTEQKGKARAEEETSVPEAGLGPVEEEKPILLDEVVAAFNRVKKLKGRVYIYGGLVLDGETTNDIDVALTNMIDKKTIIDACPQYYGRMKFSKIEEGKTPKGNYLEVNVIGTKKEGRET